MCHQFSADHTTQLEKKVGKGKGEWMHFRTQLLKRKNKLHFKAFLESFLLKNIFGKHKKQMGTMSEKSLLNITHYYFVE